MARGIDLDAARRLVQRDLPARSRWWVDLAPCDYDFSAARQPLRDVESEVEARWMQPSWRHLAIFGSCDVAEGGGARPWLTIDRRDGAVLSLDLESTHHARWLLNSSLERFVATFRLLDPILGQGRPLPPDLDALVRGLDPDAFDESEWRALLDDLLRH